MEPLPPGPAPRRPAARFVRLAAFGALGFGVALLAGGLAAVSLLQGDRLARLVVASLPALAGRIEARAIRWQPRLFADLLTDTPTPIEVDGLRLLDPQGVEVLRAPKVKVKIRPRSALGLRIILHDLELGPGSFWRFARLKGRLGTGFIRAFRRPGEPPPAPPQPDDQPFLLQIVNARLAGLTAQFEYPDWGLELRDLHVARASLLVDGEFVGWEAPGAVSRGGGFLRILTDVLPIDRVEVNQVATTRAAPDDIQLDLRALHTGRSRLTARGAFTAIYGYGVPFGQLEPPSGIALRAEIHQPVDALSAVLARRGLGQLRLAGDHARVTAQLSDTFDRLKIAGEIAGLDLSWQPGGVAGEPAARALDLRLAFAFDLDEPLRLRIPALSFRSPAGGRLELDAGLQGPAATARLRFERFATAAYLPPGLRGLGAGVLQGSVGLTADLDRGALAVEGLDLRFDRRFGRGLPRSLVMTGRAQATPQGASTRGVTIRVPGATLTATGRFTLAHQVLGLGLRLTAAELPRLLGSLGLPPLARSAQLSLDVGGTVLSPEAQGRLVVRGLGLGSLPAIGELAARFSLAGGTARLESLAGQAFGGRVEGSGSARLFAGRITRWLPAPLIDLRLDGRQIDLATLVPDGLVRGRVDLQVRARGSLDRWQADLRLPPGAELVVLGEPWRLDGLEVAADQRAVHLRSGKLVRSGGGEVELHGRLELAGRQSMQWQVTVRDLPLEAVPGLREAGVPVRGRLSADLALTGTPERPLARGLVRLAGVQVRGADLGDGLIRLQPTADGGVAVSGDLFGKLQLAGRAGYDRSGYRLEAGLEFRDLVLEQLLPEMAGFGDARGRVSGGVRVELASGRPLGLEVKLQKLELSASRAGSLAPGGVGGRRFFLRNASDIRVLLAGANVTVDRTRLVTDGGEFRLWGELRDDVVRAEVEGSLNLELLQPLVADRVESLGGQVYLSARVAGTPRQPLGEGTLSISRPITVRLPEITPTLSVPSGTVTLARNALSVRGLAVEAEGARLQIEGGASFDGRQRIQGFDLRLGGDLSGALVEALSGAALAEATGRARLQARLQGSPADPRVSADLDLAGLGFRLRDLGRDVAFQKGRVRLRQEGITLDGIEARVDGQGRLVIGGGGTPGTVAFTRLSPRPVLGAVKIPLSGRRLGLRVSDSVELDDLGFDLVLGGDLERGLTVAGEVLVASGRYVRDFTVRNLVISPSIDESAVRPFYEGQPLLENLALRLRVRTVGDSFMVQNNLAPELHMVFDLLVHGTLAKTRIAGEVRPTDGRFHVFGVRGDFNLIPNVNHITFVDTKSMDRGETPELNLEAESVVVDAANREHVVRMRISGPVGQAQIDLSSNTGLDRNQALLLLISGRTNEQEAAFGTPRSPTLGSNVRAGTDVIDQLARDSVADFLEPYIDDTLHLLTGGKLNLRPTVGPDGFEVRVDARAGRQFDFQLSLLLGLQNQRQYRAESRLWIMDYVTVRGLGEQMTFSPQEGIIEDTRSLRLELSLDFPIRPFLR